MGDGFDMYNREEDWVDPTLPRMSDDQLNVYREHQQDALDDALSDYVDRQIERIDWSNPEEILADPACTICGGSGSAPGDMVEYGMGMVSMPSSLCDCLYDRMYRKAEQKYEDGEIVFNHRDKLVDVDPA